MKPGSAAYIIEKIMMKLFHRDCRQRNPNIILLNLLMCSVLNTIRLNNSIYDNLYNCKFLCGVLPRGHSLKRYLKSPLIFLFHVELIDLFQPCGHLLYFYVLFSRHLSLFYSTCQLISFVPETRGRNYIRSDDVREEHETENARDIQNDIEKSEAENE